MLNDPKRAWQSSARCRPETTSMGCADMQSSARCHPRRAACRTPGLWSLVSGLWSHIWGSKIVATKNMRRRVSCFMLATWVQNSKMSVKLGHMGSLASSIVGGPRPRCGGVRGGDHCCAIAKERAVTGEVKEGRCRVKVKPTSAGAWGQC